MEKLIEFFLSKSRLNYMLFVFLFIFGVFSYISIPKDVFPAVKLDKIVISGGYGGASIDTLDKMAVSKLESDLNSLNGVKKLESFIKNSSFDIILTLEKGSDKSDILNKTKDVISNTKRFFPNDMDEPIATILDMSWPLINVSISSEVKSKDDLVQIAKDIKRKLASVENVAKVNLYEDSDKNFEITFDSKKIEMYGLDKFEVLDAITKLSYIYPIGKVEDKNEHLFISTFNGKKEIEDLANTLVKVGGKSIYLSDILEIDSKYDDSNVISSFNGIKNIELGISKNERANAIELVEIIKAKIEEFNKSYPDIKISTFYDTSVYIRNRLNTVVSSILFGLILVGIALYILVNKRIAFVVVLGIPSSILIGVMLMHLFGYSINMMTLLGTLLILGVLVDDAIIISENIQRHISNGDDKFRASLDGVREVIIPVSVSTLTTIFAFTPMLMLSGEMGEFFKMIPIAIVGLLIASLIESFIFLPIHSLHLLNRDDKELDWSKFQNLYEKTLRVFIKYRKTFLAIFILFVPFISFSLMSSMKFVLFPEFDSDRVFIKGKFNVNHTEEQVYEKIRPIENLLLKDREALGIKSVSMTAGFRTDNMGEAEIKQNVFEFNVELHNNVPQNFVDRYITPNLTFDYDDSLRIREKSANEIELYLTEQLKDYKPEGIEDFIVKKEGAGIINNDIEIFVNADNKELLLKSIRELKDEIGAIEGVTSVDDTAKEGVKELKLKINKFGEELGFSEGYIANILNGFFLKSELARALGKDGIIEIITYDKLIDSFETLKNFEINLPNSEQQITLFDICDFVYISTFDSIYKDNGIDVKSVFANVDTKKVTPMEVLEVIEPTLKKLEESGVKVIIKGEQEQNEQMAKEMAIAFAIALFFIFVTLLIMFDSFKSTFIILSTIPFSFLGAIIGHLILDMSLTMPSVVGILGLAGVVINDGIVMLDFIRKSQNLDELLHRAKLRLRPIIITSITTFLGLSTLIFFATGQAKILQPIAISLGFGLMWGTILNLIYLPALFAVLNKKRIKN